MSRMTLFWVCVYTLSAYALFRAVSRRHGVEATLAWVFAIVALPVVGAVSYLLLSSPGIRRTTRRKRISARTLRKTLSRPGHAAPGLSVDALEGSLLQLAVSLTGLMPTAGNRVELLADNKDAVAKMRAAVTSARHSVWSEYYIIQNDETGHHFLEDLTERARAGVEVRLLYDALGSMGLDAARLKALKSAGGKVEAFLPINPLRRRWSVHLRNHRKMIVVDGKIGFTGGMNVGDEYSGSSRRKGAQVFHDTHLMLRGPAVGGLAQTFVEDWLFATDEQLPPPPHPSAEADDASIVAVVPSGPDQEHNANALVFFAGIASARNKVFLTSPYFIPDQAIFQALISAAMRGVDVRVLVPRKGDIALVGAAARSYFLSLVRGGVRVFEYLPSMLHAKTLMVDDRWGIVGSANLDIRSFRLNFELGALVLDPVFARELEARFHHDLAASAEVTKEALGSRGRLVKLKDSFARLLSPLM
ncbi:MAG TPA: cardiolipin synthase [bacterium]|nr:cardiolipin synthase [bacterium]